MLIRHLRWGLAGALVAWTLIRALGLERGYPLVPMFAFTPYVALLALVVAGLAVWRRWWRGAVVVGACAVILTAPLVPRAVPNRAPANAPGVRLRVLAANVAANDVPAERVLRDLRRWDVDVFSVVELPPEVVAAYDSAGIRSVLPHRALRALPGFEGTGLYSRLPLRQLPGPRGTEFGLAAAELRPPGTGPVEIVSVHIRAPTDSNSAAQWRREMRTLPSAGRGPLRVLAGDFNATLDHAGLRGVLDRGYRDAAEQAGVGLRPTWPAGRRRSPTLVTIDHVLADRRARVISARSVAIPGSDHRGVLAELLLPRG
jgi:endonuclease/exonuclease/phosphatase (EEP) superfamily protein YafD